MKKLVYFLLLFFPFSVWAVKVSPVRFDTSIPRGTSQEFTLNLVGTEGLNVQNLVIYPSDLSMDRHGALAFDSLKIIMTNKSSRKFYASLANSAVDWIKIETPQLSLFEKQSRPVKFKVTVPKNAAPGEYYAVIMVEPKQFQIIKKQNDPVKFEIKTRVAVVFVLDVPGRVYEKKGEALDLKVNANQQGVNVISAFKNAGNVHLDVSANVIIRRASDKMSFGNFDIKAVGSMQPSAFIFPGATRDFEGVLSRSLPSGDYLAEIRYNYGYNFHQAVKTLKFTVDLKTPLNESQTHFLSLNTNAIDLVLASKALRSQVIKLTNTDYRPLEVSIVPTNNVTVNPIKFSLKPGEVRNVQAIIKAPQSEDNITNSVIFQTDRGKSEILKITVRKMGTKK